MWTIHSLPANTSSSTQSIYPTNTSIESGSSSDTRQKATDDKTSDPQPY